jgi:ureidoacrylate peracid hydrolase
LAIGEGQRWLSKQIARKQPNVSDGDLKVSAQKSPDDWKEHALSRIEPHRTALLVIDLQRDFCSNDGALAALGSDVSPCREVADRIAKFLPTIRADVALTAFFQLIYDPEKMSESQRERLIRNGRPIICAPGSAGSELSIKPAPGDLVFTKYRYSAFSNDRLRRLLHERSISTVAVAGVDTHICVEGTVRQGYDLGYRMIVLSDLVATRQSEFARHENSLAICGRYFALTMESNAFFQLMKHEEPIAYKRDAV